LPDTPVITPEEAGQRFSRLSNQNDFCFFEYWISDYTGHKRDMRTASQILTTFDQVLGGLISSWDDEQGLILITSDHGNLEDLSVKNHTRNPVPAILVGSEKLRISFTQDLKDLSDIYPAILRHFKIH
jgi:bisphosphoglycerate-independent phosphoglycerate mutase (AlkP superfamily)